METKEKSTHLTAAVAMSNVISLLASYLEGPDEFPNDLVLTIGGCLIEHIDACGDDADPDIKRLYDVLWEPHEPDEQRRDSRFAWVRPASFPA